VRNAVKLLVEEGLVGTRQGKHTVVLDRVPTHPLVVTSWAPAGYPTDRVAEPLAPDTGAIRREFGQDTAAVPRQFAELLGLTPGDLMVQRTITEIVNGEPIMISTSYLPVDLVGDAEVWHNVDWHDVKMGQLALVGHDVTVERPQVRARPPAPAERTKLDMAKGVSLIILSRACQVQVGERMTPAGVIVLTRGDRVFVC
jgi:GntR family transcriptional regulator